MSMVCLHLDFDEYFEKCGDCGQTLEQIHEAECVLAGVGFDTEVDEIPTCPNCGLQQDAATTAPDSAFPHPEHSRSGHPRP